MAQPFPFNTNGLPESSIKFVVDDSQVLEFVAALQDEIPNIMARIEERTSGFARQILAGTFYDAMDRLSYDQFAPEFRDKLLENLGKIPIITEVDGNGGQVSFDLEFLGTKEDLERAFHRHAVLETHHQLTEPYTGQALAVRDADVRHEFFLAMMRGEAFQGRDGRVIQTAGLWQTTKQEYLEIWGDKSPQWLYLEYGQSRFEPKIPAYSVIEEVQANMEALVDLVFTQEFDAAFKIANQAQVGIARNLQTLRRAPAGGLTIRGKTYEGGQFVGPRANF